MYQSALNKMPSPGLMQAAQGVAGGIAGNIDPGFNQMQQQPIGQWTGYQGPIRMSPGVYQMPNGQVVNTPGGHAPPGYQRTPWDHTGQQGGIGAGVLQGMQGIGAGIMNNPHFQNGNPGMAQGVGAGIAGFGQPQQQQPMPSHNGRVSPGMYRGSNGQLYRR